MEYNRIIESFRLEKTFNISPTINQTMLSLPLNHVAMRHIYKFFFKIPPGMMTPLIH